MTDITFWTSRTREFNCHACGAHVQTVSRLAKHCEACRAVRDAERQARANEKLRQKRARLKLAEQIRRSA